MSLGLLPFFEVFVPNDSNFRDTNRTADTPPSCVCTKIKRATLRVIDNKQRFTTFHTSYTTNSRCHRHSINRTVPYRRVLCELARVLTTLGPLTITAAQGNMEYTERERGIFIQRRRVFFMGLLDWEPSDSKKSPFFKITFFVSGTFRSNILKK